MTQFEHRVAKPIGNIIAERFDECSLILVVIVAVLRIGSDFATRSSESTAMCCFSLGSSSADVIQKKKLMNTTANNIELCCHSDSIDSSTYL